MLDAKTILADPVVQAIIAETKVEMAKIIARARYDIPPDWAERARAAGKVNPCPICKATGSIPTRCRLDGGALQNLPYITCYHCGGSGDESAGHRRNHLGT